MLWFLAILDGTEMQLDIKERHKAAECLAGVFIEGKHVWIYFEKHPGASSHPRDHSQWSLQGKEILFLLVCWQQVFINVIMIILLELKNVLQGGI